MEDNGFTPIFSGGPPISAFSTNEIAQVIPGRDIFLEGTPSDIVYSVVDTPIQFSTFENNTTSEWVVVQGEPDPPEDP